MFLIYWAWTDVEASDIAFQHELAPIPVALRSVLRTAFRAIECPGGQARKFKGFMLSHVEYLYKPMIAGAGATFPYVDHRVPHACRACCAECYGRLFA
jgi:hypothetical protein